MPWAPKTHRPCNREKLTRHEAPRAKTSARGYGWRWQKARDPKKGGYLLRHPLCAECERNGRVTVANVVDHIIPHRLNYKLQWDRANWQALCTSCHNAKTAKGL